MLAKLPFKNSYSSGYNEPIEFFTEALIESVSFDLGLGFFSSSGISSLAAGFAIFIANGGSMRIIINNILSEKDKETIINGQNHIVKNFEARVINDINELTKKLSCRNEHFFECLSYLISEQRIQFVATISTKGGLGHDKYGVFMDEDGHKIAFIGSANFSKTAFELNGETITVFKSPEDQRRIDEYEFLFNESWKSDTPHLIHIALDEVKTFILEKFPTRNLSELIKKGLYIRELNESEDPIDTAEENQNIYLSKRLIEKLEAKEQEPRFPFSVERDIQKDAYNAWIMNNKKGVFAMATGSGKTVTALNCVLKQYKENGYYKAIIVVPTQALAIQWQKEAEFFNFKNIVSTHTDKDWKNIISRYTTRCLLDQTKSLILITTYATFNRKDLQSFVSQTKGIDTFIYIADEAHNLGSHSSLKNLPERIQWRIGLSATPERVYDEIGSNKIFNFFDSYYPDYTYRYTMKQAIDDGILCHYDYYPIFIELTSVEMKEYTKITKQLCKYIDSETGKYRPEAEVLLLKRKRIVHKAENKKIAITKLLESLNNNKSLDYTFVFVPEGYEPDYSENESHVIEQSDIHIIDEYAKMFKQQGYRYHNFISGIDDAPGILKSFADGDIQILLSMKCLDEGIDIPRTENAIFCSSTGNPRQFVQRRGRVLRKSAGKEKAQIWDLVVIPPELSNEVLELERNLFMGEVKRIVNFASLADNQINILYGDLRLLCEKLNIDLFDMLDSEDKKYK